MRFLADVLEKTLTSMFLTMFEEEKLKHRAHDAYQRCFSNGILNSGIFHNFFESEKESLFLQT